MKTGSALALMGLAALLPREYEMMLPRGGEYRGKAVSQKKKRKADRRRYPHGWKGGRP